MSDDTISQSNKIKFAELAFESSIERTQEESSELDVSLKANASEESQEMLQAETEENAETGMTLTRKLSFRKKEIRSDKVKNVEESVLVRKGDADDIANEFSQRQGNREYRLNARLLGQLAEDLGVGIHEELSPDELIFFIRQRMTDVDGQSPDPVVVDKALEFLMEFARRQVDNSTGPAKERFEAIFNKLVDAKFKHFESNAPAIQVGQKIIGAVDAVVETTGQTIKEALNHYRDVVHNPPDLQTLRKHYEGKGYKEMVLELKGLNTYLGGNFKRTNLESPELAQLASAARKMQALLGVFRQAKIQLETLENYLLLHQIFGFQTVVSSKDEREPEELKDKWEDSDESEESEDSEDSDQKDKKDQKDQKAKGPKK